MEEVIVSCVIKHLSLVDALQSLVNYQYREDHAEEYDLVCKIMAETFKKINAMERQLQVNSYHEPNTKKICSITKEHQYRLSVGYFY